MDDSVVPSWRWVVQVHRVGNPHDDVDQKRCETKRKKGNPVLQRDGTGLNIKI